MTILNQEIDHIFKSGANELSIKELVHAHLEKIRAAVADYMWSEGCSCCRDIDAHKVNEAKIAALLDVPAHEDGGGFNFDKFKSQTISEQ